jgi:hypothetical protein
MLSVGRPLVKKKANWPLLILASGATAVWQFYDITTATEAPRQTLAILQYVILGMAAVSCVGSIGMYLSGKP